jgi:hypothetical protein
LYKANDIAIITLDAPVPFSRTVGSVCLPPASTDPDQYSGRDAIVLGWDGKQSPIKSIKMNNQFRFYHFDIAGNTVLQQGKVAIATNNEDCKATTQIGQYVSSATICATSETVFTCIVSVFTVSIK